MTHNLFWSRAIFWGAMALAVVGLDRGWPLGVTTALTALLMSSILALAKDSLARWQWVALVAWVLVAVLISVGQR